MEINIEGCSNWAVVRAVVECVVETFGISTSREFYQCIKEMGNGERFAHYWGGACQDGGHHTVGGVGGGLCFPAISSVSKRVLNHAWPSIQNSSQKLNLNRMRIVTAKTTFPLDDFSSRHGSQTGVLSAPR
jgi:hypothetical protein